MYKMPEVTNFNKKDNTYCCVPLCNSRGSKNPDLSFHLFPSEKRELDRRRKWILALRIGRPVTSRMSVCSRHFVHSDYVLPPHIGRKTPRLRKYAIPSLNLPSAHDYEPEKRPITVVIRKESSSVEAVEVKSEENIEQGSSEIEIKKEPSSVEAVEVKSEGNIEQDSSEIKIKKEPSSLEAVEVKSEENIEQDSSEAEVKIKSECDYFETDDNIGSERHDLKIIRNERNYSDTGDDIEFELDCLQTEDNIESKIDYLETDSHIESKRDYFETEDNIRSQRHNLKIIEVDLDYLDTGDDIESGVQAKLFTNRR